MRTTCGRRPVTSSTSTATVSRIPTGVRSPIPDWDDYACCVRQSGDVYSDNHVRYDSYGCVVRQTIPKFYNFLWLRSPYTNYESNVAWDVISSGYVFIDEYGINVDNSYGCIYFRRARTTPSARGSWPRLATASTTLSLIPTVFSGKMCFQISFKIIGG